MRFDHDRRRSVQRGVRRGGCHSIYARASQWLRPDRNRGRNVGLLLFRVRVHLRPDGALQGVTLLESSGVDFLDEEGIDAFRRAQPFVNPPPQLVEADGLIHFNFGFIFELSGNTRFRVLRY